MNFHERFIEIDTYAPAARPRFAALRAFGARIAAWLATARDYHAAAATYEQLSGLSDAELSRRGLSRETLARDICEHYERTKD